MPNWVNFAEIRAKVSIEDVLLRFYGVQTLTRQGEKLIGPCPIHNGDSPRAFHADLEKNIWHCFSRCQKGGNQLDLVALKEGISIREAALKLQAFFLGPGSDPPPTGGATAARPPATAGPSPAPVPAARKAITEARDDDEPPERNPALAIELQLHHDHPHLISDRKLKVATTERFGVGYCFRGIMRGAIAIPIHDEEGQLVAYAGRRLKPDEIRTHGKYKFPKGFRKELVLYNLNRVNEIGREHGLVLVEGFFAVLALFEAGIEHVVAAMGCELSEHQVELLSAFPEIVILFDGDDAGRAGAASARAKLAEKTILRTIHLPDGVKPDDLSSRALKWLVNGVQLLDLEEIRYAPRSRSTAGDMTPRSHGSRA